MNARKTIKHVLKLGIPVPRAIRPIIRLFYRAGVVVAESGRAGWKILVVEPVFRSIAEVGSGLRIERIPYIRGNGRIVVGANAYLSGKIGIGFAGCGECVPELLIGDNVFVGHNCAFVAAERISIGANCLIGNETRIQDNDGHPLDADLRRAGEGVDSSGIKPVIIEDGVWIAPRSTILKGVRIGRNSVIGVGSVVTKDVPPGTLAAGNPAKVIKTIWQGGGIPS
jgi:acetyltransferase-like isoleucine patch superfamily enzyme